MAPLGRKPRGAQAVDSLVASDHAKARLKAFLETLFGEISVDEACQRLGICQSRFFDQRNDWLHESVRLLEPRVAGRPRQTEPRHSAAEVQTLRESVQELRARAAAVEVQAELVRTLPHVVARATVPKKTSTPRRPNHPK